METTFGTLDPPLGKVRLNIAGLVTAAIATNTKIINEELAKTEIIQTLLVRFLKRKIIYFLRKVA